MINSLLILAALGQSATFTAGKTSTTIQAEMLGRYFQVDAKVNGKPVRLILDTGAGANVLTKEAAKRLGIEGGIVVPAQGAGSQRTEARLVTLDSIQVGDATVSGDNAVVIDLPAALQCDGLVGYSFLRHFATTFDYDNVSLTFTDPKAFQAPAGATATDLKIVQNHPRISGTVEGLPGWFTLDTGANGTITLTTPFVEANGLREKYHVGKPRISGKGVGGFTMGYFTTLPSLTLAGVSIPPVPAILSAQKEGVMAAGDMVGNVGAEILSHFIFTLDYPGKKAYFTKTANFDRPFRVDRSGAWIDFEKGTFKLAGVAPGSPAEAAGLRAGDEILAIDGKPVVGIPPLTANRPLQGPSGTKVKLTYRRDGKDNTVELTLRDLT